MREHDAPLPSPAPGDRPGDDWVCGREVICEGCSRGPTPRGHCTRIEDPCTPVRTYHGRRKLAVRSVVLLGVGVLLLGLAGPWRREFLAPGPLSQPHAQILSGKLRNDRCAACHPAARGSLAAWFGTASEGHAGVTQLQLCMDCHHASMDRKYAEFAHNLPPEMLAKISLRLASRPATEVDEGAPGKETHPWQDLLPGSGPANDSVACAVCHREHGGSMTQLASLSDTQCQTCHSERFASFDNGHPEFGDWPYGRADRIRFNHATHAGKHFVEAKQMFDCRQCHAVDERGEITRAGSYAESCASCHDQGLRTRLAEEVELVQLPTIDPEVFKTHAATVGAWPEFASGVDRLRLPALMRTLVSQDQETREAITRWEAAGGRLMREPPSDADLEAMAQIAEATKTLIADLAMDPGATMLERLRHPAAGQLVRQLSPQLVDDARDRWFMPVKPDGGAEADATEPASFAARGDSTVAGWFRDDAAGHIAYRAAEHADPLLRVLCELAASNAWDANEREAIRSLPAVAACVECHVVPEYQLVTGPGASVAESTELWRSLTVEDRPRGFTVFSHQPHLNIRELADCQHCHRVRSLGEETLARDSFSQAVLTHGPAAEEVATEEPGDGEESPAVALGIPSRELGSQFHTLHRAACISCHTKRAAGNACVQCHRYHVRLPQGAISPLPEADGVVEPMPVAVGGGSGGGGSSRGVTNR